MKPYEHNGVIGYSKQQALTLIGCSRLTTVTRLISQGRLEIVGSMPLPHMPHVKRKLLSVESVELCAESYAPRTYGTHMYQVRMSTAQLQAVKIEFPTLSFIDLTESRRIKREAL
jgi:hypothetical protein